MLETINHAAPETMISGQQSLFKVPQPEYPKNYQILVGHSTNKLRMKTTEELHSQYVTLTDELIQAILSGRENRNVSDEVVVFLDKSARPLSWLMRELWPILSPGVDGITPELPTRKFVNIDRNQWIPSLESYGETLGIDALPIKTRQGLRQLFSVDPSDKNSASFFDDKKIIIVDEVRCSGETLRLATSFFRDQFPSSELKGLHWMAETVVRTNSSGVTRTMHADNPVWYSDKHTDGRGVGERDPKGAENLRHNSRQYIGRFFLSTAPKETDKKALLLRNEFKQLAADVLKGNVFVIPDYLNSDAADHDRRAVALNPGINTIEEYCEAVKALKFL